MESAKDFIKRRSEKYQNDLDKYQETKEKRYLRWWPDINRKGGYWVLREKWMFKQQSDHDEKIFLVERFKTVDMKSPISNSKAKIGVLSYRIGYFMVGKNGNRKEKWTWGESCAIIPREDFNKLIKEAKKRKVIL